MGEVGRYRLKVYDDQGRLLYYSSFRERDSFSFLTNSGTAMLVSQIDVVYEPPGNKWRNTEVDQLVPETPNPRAD